MQQLLCSTFLLCIIPLLCGGQTYNKRAEYQLNGNVKAVATYTYRTNDLLPKDTALAFTIDHMLFSKAGDLIENTTMIRQNDIVVADVKKVFSGTGTAISYQEFDLKNPVMKGYLQVHDWKTDHHYAVHNDSRYAVYEVYLNKQYTVDSIYLPRIHAIQEYQRTTNPKGYITSIKSIFRPRDSSSMKKGTDSYTEVIKEWDKKGNPTRSTIEASNGGQIEKMVKVITYIYY